MCFGGNKKQSAPPAPAPVAPNPTNVADNSNDAQRRAVVTAQTPKQPSYEQGLNSTTLTATA